MALGTSGSLGIHTTARLGIGYSSSARVPGRYGTILACDAALSAEEQAAARLYLSSKYGVPG